MTARRPSGAPGRRASVCSEGALVLVVGPSGAGKDSILRAVREETADAPGVRFARRCITRAPGVDEDNIGLSATQFTVARSLGGFILSWDAHGLSYGLPASIGIDLALGMTVVANASRGVVEAARMVWPRTFIVLVTASPDVLRMRLRDRARDADLAGRINRGLAFGEIRPDLVIVNDGSIGEAGRAFVSFLTSVSSSNMPDARMATT
jgi:ribose 1,5-bisphosphokinase